MSADVPLRPLVGEAVTRLEEAGVDSPRWDAEQLAAFVADVPRSALHSVRALDAEQARRLRRLVERRAERVPLQHLTGSVGFRYIDLYVGPGVFVPRPETELVAGVAIERAQAAGPHPLVIDLCSGSGAIALSVANEVPGAQVHAVELDPHAVAWLTRNAEARHAAGDPVVTVHQGDIRHALPDLDGTVDVVASNPPYVAEHELALVDPEVRDHDPAVALVAGADGLAVIATVAARGLQLLKPGGWLVVEHSDRQGESAPALLRDAGFVEVSEHEDHAGRPRIAQGRKPHAGEGSQP